MRQFQMTEIIERAIKDRPNTLTIVAPSFSQAVKMLEDFVGWLFGYRLVWERMAAKHLLSQGFNPLAWPEAFFPQIVVRRAARAVKIMDTHVMFTPPRLLAGYAHDCIYYDEGISIETMISLRAMQRTGEPIKMWGGARGSGRTYDILEQVLAHAQGHLPKVLIVVGRSKEFATGYLLGEFAKVCQNNEVPFRAWRGAVYISDTLVRFKGQEETLRGYDKKNIHYDHGVR